MSSIPQGHGYNDTHRDTTSLAWLSICKQTEKDHNNPSSGCTDRSRSVSGEGADNRKHPPGSGAAKSPEPGRSDQPKYTTESATEILSRFGLDKDDLGELNAYSEDQITPENLKYILMQISIKKKERAAEKSSESQPTIGLKSDLHKTPVKSNKVIDCGDFGSSVAKKETGKDSTDKSRGKSLVETHKPSEDRLQRCVLKGKSRESEISEQNKMVSPKHKPDETKLYKPLSPKQPESTSKPSKAEQKSSNRKESKTRIKETTVAGQNKKSPEKKNPEVQTELKCGQQGQDKSVMQTKFKESSFKNDSSCAIVSSKQKPDEPKPCKPLPPKQPESTSKSSKPGKAEQKSSNSKESKTQIKETTVAGQYKKHPEKKIPEVQTELKRGQQGQDKPVIQTKFKGSSSKSEPSHAVISAKQKPGEPKPCKPLPPKQPESTSKSSNPGKAEQKSSNNKESRTRIKETTVAGQNKAELKRGQQGRDKPVIQTKFKGSSCKNEPSHAIIRDCKGISPESFPHYCSICNKESRNVHAWCSHMKTTEHREKCKTLYPDLFCEQQFPRIDSTWRRCRETGKHKSDSRHRNASRSRSQERRHRRGSSSRSPCRRNSFRSRSRSHGRTHRRGSNSRSPCRRNVSRSRSRSHGRTHRRGSSSRSPCRRNSFRSRSRSHGRTHRRGSNSRSPCRRNVSRSRSRSHGRTHRRGSSSRSPCRRKASRSRSRSHGRRHRRGSSSRSPCRRKASRSRSRSHGRRHRRGSSSRSRCRRNASRSRSRSHGRRHRRGSSSRSHSPYHQRRKSRSRSTSISDSSSCEDRRDRCRSPSRSSYSYRQTHRSRSRSPRYEKSTSCLPSPGMPSERQLSPKNSSKNPPSPSRSGEKQTSGETSVPQDENSAETLVKKLLQSSAVQSLSKQIDVESLVKTLTPVFLDEFNKLTSTPGSSEAPQTKSTASSPPNHEQEVGAETLRSADGSDRSGPVLEQSVNAAASGNLEDKEQEVTSTRKRGRPRKKPRKTPVRKSAGVKHESSEENREEEETKSLPGASLDSSSALLGDVKTETDAEAAEVLDQSMNAAAAGELEEMEEKEREVTSIRKGGRPRKKPRKTPVRKSARGKPENPEENREEDKSLPSALLDPSSSALLGDVKTEMDNETAEVLDQSVNAVAAGELEETEQTEQEVTSIIKRGRPRKKSRRTPVRKSAGGKCENPEENREVKDKSLPGASLDPSSSALLGDVKTETHNETAEAAGDLEEMEDTELEVASTKKRGRSGKKPRKAPVRKSAGGKCENPEENREVKDKSLPGASLDPSSSALLGDVKMETDNETAEAGDLEEMEDTEQEVASTKKRGRSGKKPRKTPVRKSAGGKCENPEENREVKDQSLPGASLDPSSSALLGDVKMETDNETAEAAGDLEEMEDTEQEVASTKKRGRSGKKPRKTPVRKSAGGKCENPEENREVKDQSLPGASLDPSSSALLGDVKTETHNETAEAAGDLEEMEDTEQEVASTKKRGRSGKKPRKAPVRKSAGGKRENPEENRGEETKSLPETEAECPDRQNLDGRLEEEEEDEGRCRADGEGLEEETVPLVLDQSVNAAAAGNLEEMEDTEQEVTSTRKRGRPRKKPRKTPVRKSAGGKPENPEENREEEDKSLPGASLDPSSSALLGDVKTESDDEAAEGPDKQNLDRRLEEEEEEDEEVACKKRRKSPCTAADFILPPFNTDISFGEEFTARKLGYYCSLCSVFYMLKSNEEDTHCCSRNHYDNLLKHWQMKEEEPSPPPKRKTRSSR
ncbi:serine/arginine repetitive matrix protein 2-like isoform X3 [Xiphophorus couchianus]|uniref:serine/arginine repetitive matrix protein 2-like isoform X3 n=1 Tax=Xiphophorus couchianus TaxID=32473 RepID=UPI0010169D39|nr:serine/arginine repetitive matrix protein 2-like isoform X3 [Xiphophorus couchianus]